LFFNRVFFKHGNKIVWWEDVFTQSESTTKAAECVGDVIVWFVIVGQGFVVGLFEETGPAFSNLMGASVVGALEDEQTDFHIAVWVGIEVEQLFKV